MAGFHDVCIDAIEMVGGLCINRIKISNIGLTLVVATLRWSLDIDLSLGVATLRINSSLVGTIKLSFFCTLNCDQLDQVLLEVFFD